MKRLFLLLSLVSAFTAYSFAQFITRTIPITKALQYAKSMTLNLSSADGTSSVYGSQIPEGSRNITLNGSNIDHGTCQLTLVENGIPVESRKFVK